MATIRPLASRARTPVVRKRVFQTGATTVAVDQRAYYLEDSWRTSPTTSSSTSACAGIPSTTRTVPGQSYVKIDNQFAPRLASAGTCSATPRSGGLRQTPAAASAADRDRRRPWRRPSLFRAVLPPHRRRPVTGAPTGLTLINNRANGRLIHTSTTVRRRQDPASIASQNLKPIPGRVHPGLQKQLTDNFRCVRAITATRKQAIDDTCDYRPPIAAGPGAGASPRRRRHSIEPADQDQAGDMAIYNPGFACSATCATRARTASSTSTSTATACGSSDHPGRRAGPKAKRKYTALEIFWEGNWDRWFCRVLQALLRQRASATPRRREVGYRPGRHQRHPDFEHPELMDRLLRLPPNDRRHSLRCSATTRSTTSGVGANYIDAVRTSDPAFGTLGGAGDFALRQRILLL